MDEFFEKNYSGSGPLVEGHTYFSVAKNTLDIMTSLGALRFGHYQHGSHHSEVFVDVENILSSRDYRNLMVTALFSYIITHDIRLVLYPNHSSAYILADDLKQRFIAGNSSVEFIMACRTFRGRGTKGTSYALTRFSPHPDPLQWKNFSSNAVLILDDAVCSGTTVESIMAELARIDRNYYDSPSSTSYQVAESRFSVHVVAFLNRLPRVTGDFWGGLSRVAAGRVQFSAFISMPLTTDSEELCPQCILEKKLEQVSTSAAYCLYAKEFLSWWISRNAVVSSHEMRHFDIQQKDRFSSEESLRLAGYLSAIERKAYKSVWGNLYDKNGISAEEKSISVRVHVRSRAGFLHDLFPRIDKSVDVVSDLCNELGTLIDMTLDDNGTLFLQDDALEILQFLTVRYLRTPPKEDEIIQVMECLFSKFIPSFCNRLLVCGIACVLDTCIAWFQTPSRKKWKGLRQALLDVLLKTSSNNLKYSFPHWALDWLSVYLADDGESVSSLGKAVQILARYAQKGRQYHIYGRSELDQLLKEIEQPISDAPACGAPEVVRRVLASCDQFNEMLVATRALRSRSAIIGPELSDLQDRTGTNVEEIRVLCNNFQTNNINLGETYNKLCSLFVDSYLLWFPKDGKAKAAQVIDFFLPSLAETVKTASITFHTPLVPQGDYQEEHSSLDVHKDLKVIVDPEVLKIAISHILGNIARLTDAGLDTQISWNVREIEDSERGVGRRRIELVASNTDTPRPNLHSLTLRGLSDVRGRLMEYGGDLIVFEPESPWTFQVAIRLQRWAEVTI
jgi:hypothetical protein